MNNYIIIIYYLIYLSKIINIIWNERRSINILIYGKNLIISNIINAYYYQ